MFDEYIPYAIAIIFVVAIILDACGAFDRFRDRRRGGTRRTAGDVELSTGSAVEIDASKLGPRNPENGRFEKIPTLGEVLASVKPQESNPSRRATEIDSAASGKQQE